MGGNLLIVAGGGALGSAARYLVSVGAARLFGTAFPAGTLIVNVVGCFAMGVFIELLALRFGASLPLRLFITTGFLGGFTTFSAFALDTAVLWERGAVGVALAYAGASVLLSLAGLAAGLALVRAVA